MISSQDLFDKDLFFRYINRQFLNEINIVDIGFERCPANKSNIYSPSRSSFALHYVFEGKGTLIIEGKSYSLSKGWLFFLPIKSASDYYPDRSDPWKYYWIEFDGAKAAALLNRMGLNVEAPVYRCENTQLIENFFRTSIYSEDFYEPSDDLNSISALFGIANAVERERKLDDEQKPPKRERYITYIINFVEKHYNDREKCNLTSIASQLFLSPIYLNNIFKEYTGIPIYKYIIDYRLHRACELLDKKTFSIAEVARMTGYADQLHFSKEFRKRMNISPSEYRRLDKEQN